jgi:enamine deaminase RidA (YjgF/YER057c/UK114 family)
VDVDGRLAGLNLALPSAAAPAANYLPYLQSGNLLFIAGQAPIRNGKYEFVGRVGDAVSLQAAQAAAQLCGLNLLAQVRAACNGDWGRVTRCVRVCGYVSSTPDFFDYPQVLDGCSNLMVAALGDAGKHVRTVMGASGLRANVPVVVDAVFELRSA